MRTASLSGVALFCALVTASALGQSKTVALPSPSALAKEIVVAQAENRPRASYQLIRKYRVFPSNNVNAASEVVAVVDFRPPTAESYTIQKTSGDRQTERVVRGILDHEVEASAQGRHVPTAAVIQDNYGLRRRFPAQSSRGAMGKLTGNAHSGWYRKQGWQVPPVFNARIVGEKNGIPKCLRSQGAFAASSVCDRLAFA